MEKPELVVGKVDWKGRKAVKSLHGGTRAAVLVLATFGFEALATISLQVNLITYFNGVMHFDLSNAANQLTNFMGVSFIICILVAVLADTYIGRYKSAVFSGCLEFTGLLLLAIQAHFSKLKPAPCNIFDPTARCEKLKGVNELFFFVALYMLAVGTGGIKATVPAHGADQFDDKDPKEVRQMSSYFNFLMMALCVGGAVSLTLLVWVQNNKGWDWGFCLSAVALFLAILIFLAGLPIYRIQAVQGSSPVTEIIQVYVAAFRNRKLPHPEDPTELYEVDNDQEAAAETEFLPHGDAYRFLDKAAIQTSSSSGTHSPTPWKLCRVTQVENAKIILGLLPIFCCTIIMTLCLAQLQTFSVQQGLTMDTRITKSFHIPPATMPIIPVAFLIFLAPFYDRVVVPFLRKFTGIPTGMTHLQRIGVGLVLACLSMATAAIMELKRRNVAQDHNMLDAIPVLQPLPISVFWLSFQYFIFGIADLFTYVGLLEFFYSEAPKALKSTSTCFLWTSMAVGYFLSTILVNIVNSSSKGRHGKEGWLEGNNLNRNHLDRFYALLSILTFISFCAYVFVARKYKYRAHNPVIVQMAQNGV